MSQSQNPALQQVRQNSTLAGASAGAATYSEMDIPHYAKQQILSRGRQNAQVRANSSLPNEVWEAIGDTLIEYQDKTKTLASDLREKGLVDSSAVLQDESITWQRADERGSATIGMSLETRDDETADSLGPQGVSLPCIFDSYSIGIRERPGSGPGQNIDIDNWQQNSATENVEAGWESLVINGWPASFNFDALPPVYGLTNHPHVNSGSLSDWSTGGDANPGLIRGDFRKGAQWMKDDQFRPNGTPYWAYISTPLEDRMNDADSEGDGNRLVRDRIEDMSFIDRVEVSEYLPGESLLMFRPTADVIDLEIVEDIQSVQWSNGPETREHNMMWSCFAPRVKSTAAKQMGAAFLSR